MDKKGYAWPIILIAVALLSYYLINTNFSLPPNSKSPQLAANLNEYPNATSWHVASKPKICMYYVTRCKETPSIITFTSEDYWPTVYKFYLSNLTKEGWRTSSHIVTSIPDSLVIGNKEYFKDAICEAIIKEDSNDYLGLLESADTGAYKIEIRCFVD